VVSHAHLGRAPHVRACSQPPASRFCFLGAPGRLDLGEVLASFLQKRGETCEGCKALADDIDVAGLQFDQSCQAMTESQVAGVSKAVLRALHTEPSFAELRPHLHARRHARHDDCFQPACALSRVG
jgi:hypothetical protein